MDASAAYITLPNFEPGSPKAPPPTNSYFLDRRLCQTHFQLNDSVHLVNFLFQENIHQSWTSSCVLQPIILTWDQIFLDVLETFANSVKLNSKSIVND